MAIPSAVSEAATKYAQAHGGSVEIYNSVIYGWQLAQKQKREKVREAVLSLDDEYTFERWWESYGLKEGRAKCEENWAKMSFDERKAAIERTPVYVSLTPNIKFRKRPLTWLNQKCWQDTYTGPIHRKLEAADPVKFMEWFNNHFKYTDIPKLSEMTDSRCQQLNVIYTLYKQDILKVLEKVKESRYLTGESGKRRPITFEEIFQVDMFVRIKDDYYNE